MDLFLDDGVRTEFGSLRRGLSRRQTGDLGRYLLRQFWRWDAHDGGQIGFFVNCRSSTLVGPITKALLTGIPRMTPELEQMFAVFRPSGKIEASFGQLPSRTSTTKPVSEVVSKSAIERVEWPMAKYGNAMSAILL
jgi:hypothetical protein